MAKGVMKKLKQRTRIKFPCSRSCVCAMTSHLDALLSTGTCNSDGEAPDEDGESVPVTLGGQMLWAWNKRRPKLDHHCAVTAWAWALSVIPENRADVHQCLDGPHRAMIEEAVCRLCLSPCPNKS